MGRLWLRLWRSLGFWTSLWVSTDMPHGEGGSSTVRASGTEVCNPREYLERAWVHVHPSTVEAGERRAHQIWKNSWQSC